MGDEGVNVGAGAGMEGALPSREQLLEAIQKMDMDEESRRKLIENIMAGVPEYAPIGEEEQAAVASSSASIEILMLIGLISLVFTVLGENFHVILKLLNIRKMFSLSTYHSQHMVQ